MKNKDLIVGMNTRELAEFLVNFSVRKAVKAVNKQWVTVESVSEWLDSEVRHENS